MYFYTVYLSIMQSPCTFLYRFLTYIFSIHIIITTMTKKCHHGLNIVIFINNIYIHYIGIIYTYYYTHVMCTYFRTNSKKKHLNRRMCKYIHNEMLIYLYIYIIFSFVYTRTPIIISVDGYWPCVYTCVQMIFECQLQNAVQNTVILLYYKTFIKYIYKIII